MTNEEKLEKINAKDFTYVQVFFDTDLESASSENPWSARFIVLTPFKAEALSAAKKIIAERWTHAPIKTRNGRGEAIHLYPRKYVREARGMLANDPGNVYEI